MYCKNEGEGCEIKDDMQMVYEDFKKADVVVMFPNLCLSGISSNKNLV